MDIRNLQKTGGQSFTVTLPKEWIISNALEDKSKLRLYPNKHHLVIAPYTFTKENAAPICNIDQMDREQIFRELIGYYLSGTTEIVVEAKKITYEQRAAVREFTYRLIGCECMESAGNRILLRNTFSLSYRDIPDFVNKMVSIILAMFADTIKYLEEKDKQLARDVMERDVEIDRLNLGIMRLTNLRLREVETEEAEQFSINEAVYYKSIATRLERIADHVVRIADYYLMIDGSIPNELGPWEKEVVKSTLSRLELCRGIISTLDKRMAHQYLDLYTEVNQRRINKKYPNKGIMDIVTSESISRINSYVANIAEETINYLNIKAALS